MPPHQRRSSAAKSRASRRTLRSRVVASPVVSEAASPTSPPAREVSPNVSDAVSPAADTPTPTPRVLGVSSSPTLSVVALGLLERKRPAFKAVSTTVAPSAFLMRFQLSATPVAKRTATLPARLSRAVCLRCSKRIDKSVSIKKKVAGKAKVISVGASCAKLPNKKCEYCAV